ncbi:LuxR family transcriptional regulator [Kitasatospora purpeofusca]|uniref:helix-turn-helix transcriptional regulator n=1 Tax=Kitasatospora purpeofusca TaxID=67352 RepID=UPI002A5A8FDD|nr:LuxR family transcriptional regulator [Kitasatospora purpeofusca]MDY0816187.1 LuxR family transcriptional regulator [Kitasatospora purpeofusca]
MVGRDGERTRLSAFVRAPDGQALVLRGEAGVGKSTLLDLAARLAAEDGQLVVRATGVEAESGLPHAGLHQLLYPLLPDAGRPDGPSGHTDPSSHTDRSGRPDQHRPDQHRPDQHRPGAPGLNATARAAFDAVFGRPDGPPPPVMALGIAVLDLLSWTASEGRPLLLVLDDGQWLDEASAEVCGFVGRRLAGRPGVKLLVAVRADTASRFDTAALPEAPVGALADADATRLLDLHHPELGRQVRGLVLEQAGGNPLALLELPAHLVGGPGDRAAQDLLGLHGVPLPRRIQEVYAARLARLGDTVRAELLRGALDGAAARPGDGPAPVARYRMREVDEAVACGLLVVEPATGEPAFRHPLVRSSVVQLATPDQRRSAHRVLAQLHREYPERRAIHLAAATVDPEEGVAADLEAAARSATRRGGARMAVSWLTRAAELSETRVDRSRRLGEAAYVAGQADHLGRARSLALAAAPGTDESPAAVLADSYLALYREGEVRATHRRIVAAVERLRDSPDRPGRHDRYDRHDQFDHRHRPDRPDEVLDRLVSLLLAVSQYAGNGATWQRTHEVLASLGDLATERAWMYGSTWSDVLRHGAGWSRRVELAASAGLEDQDPWDVTRLAVSAYHLDVLSPLRPYLERVVDRELDTGAMSSGIVMLHLVLLDQLALGQWDAAERTGHRALALATERGHGLFAHQTRAYLAQLAAVRGRTAEARELQAAVDAWARPRGVEFLTQIADAVGATAALGAGDYETAFLHAIGITAPGAFRPYAYQASRTLLDLVEAALHTGRAEQARAHALAARDAGLPDLSPRLALITHGALAMTAEDDTKAAAHYARAQTHPAAERFPFELARIRLAHGIGIRRLHGAAAARLPLTQAARAFDRLGAPAWAARAHAELRAAGVAPRAPAPAPLPLTWQERRVAELAAGGLTNKEIGEQMRLSPRTVGAHLYRAFPKLGITTRAALRDALTRISDPTPTP